MAWKNIIEKCDTLNTYEKRKITDEYYEVVVYNNEINNWNQIIMESLGPAKKSAGTQPDNSDNNLTKYCGGIYTEQTLFVKDYDDATLVAMFWPWKDEIHTTFKMIRLKTTL